MMQTKEYFDRMEQTAKNKVKTLREYMHKGDKVLDFGSGPSDFMYNFVTAFGGEYVALDNSVVVQNELAKKHIPVISEEMLGEEEYDIIYMSSVFHEILSYLSRIEAHKTMQRIVKALKPEGVLIIRDWQTLWGDEDWHLDTDEELEILVKETLSSFKGDVVTWAKVMRDTGVINDYIWRNGHVDLKSLYELVFHVTWGLGSLDREAQERYHFEPLDWFYFEHNLYKLKISTEKDESYKEYLSKYYSQEFIEVIFKMFNTKETRVYRKY